MTPCGSLSRRSLAIAKTGNGFSEESERLSRKGHCYPQFSQLHTTSSSEPFRLTLVLDVRLATRLACRGADQRPAADPKRPVEHSPEQASEPVATRLPRHL